jgi:hypothetical protein
MSAGDDDASNAEARDETPLERLDRQWAELLQELRVVQTGVQLLTGFLLTLPFQQRFTTLGTAERTVYLVAVSASIVATTFLTTPVSMHRAVFRRNRRRETVELAHRMAIVGLGALGCALVAVSTLIFEVVHGWGGGVAAGAVCATMLGTLWLAVPLAARRRAPLTGNSSSSRGPSNIGSQSGDTGGEAAS